MSAASLLLEHVCSSPDLQDGFLQNKSPFRSIVSYKRCLLHWLQSLPACAYNLSHARNSITPSVVASQNLYGVLTVLALIMIAPFALLLEGRNLISGTSSTIQASPCLPR